MNQNDREAAAAEAQAALLAGTAHVRNTGLYRVVMPGIDWDRLDRIIDRMAERGTTLQGANVVNGKGYAQFRAATDMEALWIALWVTEGDDHHVAIGLGAHTRIIRQPGIEGDYDGGPTPEPQEPDPMLAREKWQIRTIAVLETVFAERVSQHEKHGDSMSHLPDGTGPDVSWLSGVDDETPASEIEASFRWDYGNYRGAENPDGEFGSLTRMHLVREEIAEAFELDGDSPEFLDEIRQVAALCVQWIEIKLAEKEASRG